MTVTDLADPPREFVQQHIVPRQQPRVTGCVDDDRLQFVECGPKRPAGALRSARIGRTVARAGVEGVQAPPLHHRVRGDRLTLGVEQKAAGRQQPDVSLP